MGNVPYQLQTSWPGPSYSQQAKSTTETTIPPKPRRDRSRMMDSSRIRQWISPKRSGAAKILITRSIPVSKMSMVMWITSSGMENTYLVETSWPNNHSQQDTFSYQTNVNYSASPNDFSTKVSDLALSSGHEGWLTLLTATLVVLPPPKATTTLKPFLIQFKG